MAGATTGRGGRRSAVATLLVLLLVLGQYAVGPLLPEGYPVGFLLVAVLFIAVRTRPGVAAVAGFLFGIAADASAATPFGATALLWVVGAFAAASMRALLFSEQLLLPGLLAAAASWVGEAVLALARPAGSALLAPGALLLRAPVSALVTGLLAVAVHLLARDASRPRPR